ncbi:hypothetical protein C0991_005015 [Blastosporella zonata]|nr:hypothetical protein C0991_005015 [Blastosporella zonata]
MAAVAPFISITNPTPPRPTESFPSSYRLLYRGALSLPDSHLLLDGLTFTARLDSPSKNNNLLENPLALALESMRGRPSLRFMGVVKLHDDNLWLDESGGIEMDINPRATLTRIYFENVFCLTPFASTSTSTPPNTSDIGIKVALGDSDGPETTQVVIFARSHQNGPSLNLIVARLSNRPPPTQSSLRLPRPDDPTPRKPPFLDGKESGKGNPLFKIPEVPSHGGKASMKGKGRQVEGDQDVFGGTGVDFSSKPISKGKRKRVVDEDAMLEDQEVIEMERANKDVAIKRCTLDHLYKSKDPTSTLKIDKSHPDFKDLFGWISRGVGFALRAHLKVQPVDIAIVERLVRSHAEMYVGGHGSGSQHYVSGHTGKPPVA